MEMGLRLPMLVGFLTLAACTAVRAATFVRSRASDVCCSRDDRLMPLRKSITWAFWGAVRQTYETESTSMSRTPQLTMARTRTEQKIRYARIHLEEIHGRHNIGPNDDWECAHEEAYWFHLAASIIVLRIGLAGRFPSPAFRQPGFAGVTQTRSRTHLPLGTKDDPIPGRESVRSRRSVSWTEAGELPVAWAAAGS